MAGHLTSKHVELYSRAITTGRKLKRDCAKETICLIDGPDRTTTIPYNHSYTPDALDIVTTEDLAFPMYPTTCSAVI